MAKSSEKRRKEMREAKYVRNAGGRGEIGEEGYRGTEWRRSPADAYFARVLM